MMRQIWARLGLSAALVITPAVVATGAIGAAGAQSSGQLTGTFAIAAGQCDGPQVSGSYFRMIHPTGDEGGPFVSNGDSSCSDQTYTPLQPGGDGGLVTGTYQPAPDPPFDSGNGTANRITRPTAFFGVSFATSTEQVDPQTGTRVPPPTIEVDGDRLSGVTSSFGAWWNGQSFNQGAPKPDGSSPGNTSALTGTFDASTGAYSLTWRSQIEGGAFDDFTGVWHLEGTFRPAGGGGSSSGGPSPSPEPGSDGGQTGSEGGAGGGPAGVGNGGAGGETGPDGDATADGIETDGDDAATDDDRELLTGEAVSTEVTSGDDGFDPASWVVVLIAAAAIGGVLWLVWQTRSRPEAGS